MTKRKSVRKWMMPFTSDPAKTYVVTLWDDGELSCNCPAWVFKRAGQDRACLHVNGVRVAEAAESGAPSVRITVDIPLPKKPDVPLKRRIVLEE